MHSNNVYNTIHTKGYRPDDVLDKSEAAPPSKEEIKRTKIKLRKMRETSDKYYAMFTNLAGIFPLLGILGTVISLLPMVQDMGNMQLNFFVALTSTLWGLVFAIFFKVLDGVLSPQIERNNRGIDDYLEKLEAAKLPGGESPCTCGVRKGPSGAAGVCEQATSLAGVCEQAASLVSDHEEK